MVNLVFILLILLIVFLPLEHQLHDSWFVAFPVPIIVLIGRKHVPINSHLMNKDGGLVFQFQLKRKKKKIKLLTGVPGIGSFGYSILGLLKVQWEKLKVYFSVR